MKYGLVLLLAMAVVAFIPACSTTSEESDAGSGDGGAGDAESRPAYDWPKCDSVKTGQKLAEKAAYFDGVATGMHLAPDGLFRNIWLTEDLTQIDHWTHVENVILWSGIYLASQAFRYAVVKSPEAVENARKVLAGLHDLTGVTGSRGLYGRSMLRPGVPYNPVAPENPGWTDSAAAGYEGWRFRNDVSKDGYAGLMFGYAVALEHFDDPGIAADIRSRIREIADHLFTNGLQIIDTTGIVTEHGRLYHSAMDDWPGFNAMLAGSWMKIASVELGDSALDDFYYGCLMKTRKGIECPKIENESVVSMFELRNYMDSMEKHLYLFQPGCQQNYDNFDMCYQAIYPLLRLETDKALRSRLVQVLRTNMFYTDNPEYQSLAPIGNTWYTFAYAALTGDGPADPMLASAVDSAVCTMKAFPEKKFRRHIPAGTQQPVCHSRLKNPVAALPIPLDVYDFDNYLWRLDFFEIAQKEIPENRREVFSPEDYLLAYWLGRYHGFIGEDM